MVNIKLVYISPFIKGTGEEGPISDDPDESQRINVENPIDTSSPGNNDGDCYLGSQDPFPGNT